MKKLLVILPVVLLCIACTAFAGKAESAQFPCFGSAAQSAVLAVFVNGTDQAIDQLRVRSLLDDTVVSEDLLGGRSIAVAERFGLWLDRGEDGRAMCDILLGFSDGRQMTLHEIDAAEFAEALICRDVNVAYMSFTRLSTGEMVSTRLGELKRLELMEADDGPIPDDSERELAYTGDLGS